MSTTLLFETLHGSRAYGLARDGSDTDLKGVLVGPPAWYFGVTPGPEQLELSADHVHYELRKFMRLAIANNPSILEILFAHEDDHRTVHPAFRDLLDRRDELLSKRVAGTFGGYALSQLARIKRHRRWLRDPPEAKPTRADFGLPDKPEVSRDQRGAAQTLLERGTLSTGDLSDGFLDLLDRERRYTAALKEWTQYQGWLKHRNAKRAALEAEHGYDTKHAMHLVRLTKMAREILQTGVVQVRRTDDREQLLAIRDGTLSYDELLQLTEEQKREIEAAKRRSSLPEAPDEEKMERLTVQTIEEVLGCR